MDPKELEILAERVAEKLLPHISKLIESKLAEIGGIHSTQHTKNADYISTSDACVYMGVSRRTLVSLKKKYPYIGYGRRTHGYSLVGLQKLKELEFNAGK